MRNYTPPRPPRHDVNYSDTLVYDRDDALEQSVRESSTVCTGIPGLAPVK